MMNKAIDKKRRTQFSLVLVIFPVIILVILEVSLRLLGYGSKTKLMFRPKYIPDLYLENLDAYNKYQDKDNQIRSNHVEDHIRNLMNAHKKEGAIRGFVVGGSAAQGFPYNSNMSFGKMIEAGLAKTGKYSEVEILNFGVSAISSYSVSDIAKKLVEYDPDFLILYAGNNEYYGAFSYSTGGTHFTRNLYMQLYELKLFQLVKDFISLFGGKEESSQQKVSIMKDRFKEMTFPKNEDIDKTIAENYVKNVQGILQIYLQNNIPVFVASPVSNILDMPPFGGENDDKIKKYAARILFEIKNNHLEKAENALKAIKENGGIENNANIMYLEATLQRAKTDSINLALFEKAKNFDNIPFRPRTELVEQLDALNALNSYENLHYFKMQEELQKKFADTILGNDIFVDHVHFNQYGHKQLAEIFTKKIAEKFHFTPAEMDSINHFFSNDTFVYDAVFSLPMYRLFANKVVNSLLSQPPFSSMAIPFEARPDEMSNAINAMGIELAEKTLPMNIDDTYKNTVVYYMNKEEYKTAHQYFMADRFMFPGSYHRYLNLGRFFRKFSDFTEDAEMAYVQAYLLSEKKKAVFDEIMGFYKEFNMPEKAKEFVEQHGKTRK